MKLSLAFARVGLVLSAFLFATLSHALDAGYSGAWYNPAESGHGVFFEVLSPTRGLLSWYVYDDRGNQVYLVADGTIDGNHLAAPAFITHGMRFGSFNTSENSTQQWGTVTLDFATCSQATLSWQSSFQLNGFTFGNGSTPLSRLTAIDGLDCGKRAASGTYVGFAIAPGATTAQSIAGILDERGQATFAQTDGSGIFIGTYTTSGSSISLNLTGYTASGYAFPNGSTVQSISANGDFRERDYLTGTSSTGGVFSLQYKNTYTRGGSLAAIAGAYSLVGGVSSGTITVSPTGALSGSDSSGCRYAGTVTSIDPRYDAYSTAIVFSNCGAANGTYSGIATLGDYAVYGDRRALTLAVRGPYVVVRTLARP